MAHRNIQITRNIVQTCNKLRAFSKPDLCTLPPHKTELTENPLKIDKNSIHYAVFNTLKNERKNQNKILSETNLMENMNGFVASPFSGSSNKPSIATSTQKGTTIFDINNFETINKKDVCGKSCIIAARTYSTKKKADQGCANQRKKCKPSEPCPKFKIDECEQAKSFECKREYHDPHCTKKMAPYPSYSELCAYRLEDNPSECQQCPWQKCGGIEDIKPQKKNYHTSTKAMNMAMIPTRDAADLAPFLLHKQCDASKEPCKEPPPKCKKRDEGKKEKCPEKKKKDKKKCMGDTPVREAWTISGSMRNLDMQRYHFSMAKIDRFKAEIGVPSNLAQRIVFGMKDKDCPKNKPKCPKREINPPVVDHRIDERYRPVDPCCEDAKKGRQPRRRPKVFVPEPRYY